MSGYIGNIPVPQATQTRESFTATASQTTFNTAGYTPNFLDVFLNGVHLLNGTDYTATNGSDVVLATGAAASDVVEVISYSTYEVNAQTYTGGLTVNNDAATVLTVDRATSDGTIIDLRKNSTTVGSIAAQTGKISIMAKASYGIKLYDQSGNDIVHAIDTSGNTYDGNVSLGYSASRFKNLYLSGGVYLGGTGAANLLDDYEEGTFTPTLGSTYGFTKGTVEGAIGRYTKVGNLVHCFITFTTFGTTEPAAAGDRFQVTGLPFTPSDISSSAISGYVGSVHVYASLGSGHNSTGIATMDDINAVYAVLNFSQGVVDYADNIFITISYRTDA